MQSREMGSTQCIRISARRRLVLQNNALCKPPMGLQLSPSVHVRCDGRGMRHLGSRALLRRPLSFSSVELGTDPLNEAVLRPEGTSPLYTNN